MAFRVTHKLHRLRYDLKKLDKNIRTKVLSIAAKRATARAKYWIRQRTKNIAGRAGASAARDITKNLRVRVFPTRNGKGYEAVLFTPASSQAAYSVRRFQEGVDMKGKRPPAQRLLPWVERRLGGDLRTAYAVARNIQKRGRIPAKGVILDDNLRERLADVMLRAVNKALREQLRKDLKREY